MRAVSWGRSPYRPFEGSPTVGPPYGGGHDIEAQLVSGIVLTRSRARRRGVQQQLTELCEHRGHRQHCSTGATSGGGTIIHGRRNTIVSLDPAGQYDFGSSRSARQIYDTLLEVPAGETTPQPALAESCDTTDRSRTHAPAVRLKFSDGSALPSADASTRFKRISRSDDRQVPCSLLALAAACGSERQRDGGSRSQTVVFHLGAPTRFGHHLTTSRARLSRSPTRRSPCKRTGRTSARAATTLAQYRAGGKVVLEKNPNTGARRR